MDHKWLHLVTEHIVCGHTAGPHTIIIQGVVVCEMRVCVCRRKASFVKWQPPLDSFAFDEFMKNVKRNIYLKFLKKFSNAPFPPTLLYVSESIYAKGN